MERIGIDRIQVAPAAVGRIEVTKMPPAYIPIAWLPLVRATSRCFDALLIDSDSITVN